MEGRRLPLVPCAFAPSAASRPDPTQHIASLAPRPPLRSAQRNAPRRARRALAIWALAAFGASAMTACTLAPPTPFTLGEVVAAPAGCATARERGHDC